MTSYPFLSSEWIDAAQSLRDEYTDQIPPTSATARFNVIVTDVPHGDGDGDGNTVKGHVDSSTGQLTIAEGHVEDSELTVTLDYGTARSAFITQDQQQVMQSFLMGKIIVDGDPTKLVALLSESAGPPPEDVEPLAREIYQRLLDLTADDG